MMFRALRSRKRLLEHLRVYTRMVEAKDKQIELLQNRNASLINIIRILDSATRVATVSEAWDGITNVTISPERLAKDREKALERVRLEINDIDTEIADLLLQRLAKGRYARYLHPEYLDDYTRELQVMARYTKKLCPYASKETVADLCITLFRMSRP